MFIVNILCFTVSLLYV